MRSIYLPLICCWALSDAAQAECHEDPTSLLQANSENRFLALRKVSYGLWSEIHLDYRIYRILIHIYIYTYIYISYIAYFLLRSLKLKSKELKAGPFSIRWWEPLKMGSIVTRCEAPTACALLSTPRTSEAMMLWEWTTSPVFPQGWRHSTSWMRKPWRRIREHWRSGKRMAGQFSHTKWLKEPSTSMHPGSQLRNWNSKHPASWLTARNLIGWSTTMPISEWIWREWPLSCGQGKNRRWSCWTIAMSILSVVEKVVE